jgi:D-serine deaminase-like pyridoxal phosphate-dependent protein
MGNLASPETYRDVFDRLERDGVRYVALSGVAVVLHGYARPVADLDIAIDPAPEEAARALRTLACAGFVPSLPLPLSMLSVLRMFDPAGREVDVFVRYHIPFDEMWAGSERSGVGSSSARVVSLEHLLRAKRINGRPHDLLDIAGLLALKAGDGPCKEPA